LFHAPEDTADGQVTVSLRLRSVQDHG
jgi:hypothetical protein